MAAAEEYLQETETEGAEWQIGLLAVELTLTGRIIRVDTIEHAVEP